MTTERIYIYKRFERFWHWCQAILIIVMAVTGFEVHGTYTILGFEQALTVHMNAAWILIWLWVFAIFWHFTTGEWRQYIPTSDRLLAMIRYYLTGIFTNAPHPYRQTTVRKHNPLQRLAYLFVKLLINPAIWVSGLLLMYYAKWGDWGIASFLSLPVVAFIHIMAAFAMLLFFIVHVYIITTGVTPLAHLKAMITGYEEVEADEAEPAGAD